MRTYLEKLKDKIFDMTKKPILSALVEDSIRDDGFG